MQSWGTVMSSRHSGAESMVTTKGTADDERADDDDKPHPQSVTDKLGELSQTKEYSTMIRNYHCLKISKSLLPKGKDGQMCIYSFICRVVTVTLSYAGCYSRAVGNKA